MKMTKWMVALATPVGGLLTLLGTAPVSAVGCGTSGCQPPGPPRVLVVGPSLSPLSLVAPVVLIALLIIYIELRRSAWARADHQRRKEISR